MKSDQMTVVINILGKEYPVSCSKKQEASLIQAARFLDEKMRNIRNSGRTIGLERIAIMAGLNIAHELVQVEQNLEEQNQTSQEQLTRLMEKVDMALDEI